MSRKRMSGAGAAHDAQFRPGERQLFFEVGQQVRFVVGKQSTDGIDGGTSGGRFRWAGSDAT
jgi:hypothetical protein